MATNKVADGTVKKINTIFNPYLKENHIEIKSKTVDIKAVGVVNSAYFWTNNTLHKADKKNIYIYKISHDFAGFWIDNWSESFFPCKTTDDLIRPALIYFEEGVSDYIKIESIDIGTAKAMFTREDRIPYYAHHLGSLNNNEAISDGILREWNIVPRELFDSGHKYVYLLLCTCGNVAPILKGYKFPDNRAFFWELPVASSIFDNDKISKSVIVNGIVKEKNIYSIARSSKSTECKPIVNIDMIDIPSTYKDIRGKFSWRNAEKQVKLDVGDVFYRADSSSDDYEMVFTRSDNREVYSCGNIGINVYNHMTFGASNKINVLMWRSGSNDDLIHSEYLGKDHMNEYPYILTSLSIGAVYGSLADLRVISPECAGHYLARHLANQSKGNRSISIDGAIENLFGGPLYRVEQLVTDNDVKSFAACKADDPDYETAEIHNDYNRSYIEELFSINDNYLFYDSPVKYADKALIASDLPIAELSDPKGDARFYVEKVLGISEGSSGCDKTKNILARLFKKIKSLKINIDYATSDMELIHCDARRLATRRFNDAYRALQPSPYNSLEIFRKNIYGTKLWGEINKRPEVLNQFYSKGYYFEGELNKLSKNSMYYPLSEITQLNMNAEDDRSIYARSYEKEYELRRDIGVWDTIMNSYENDIFYRFIYQPVLSQNKNARCGAYARSKQLGFINFSTQFEHYLGGNTLMDNSLSSTVVLYGGTGTSGYQKTSMDTWTMYPNKTSVLKMLTESVNSLRSSLAASSGRTQVYIASAEFFENDALKGSELMDELKNSYGDVPEAVRMIYRELMYHIFLHAPEKVYAYIKHSAKNPKEKYDYYSRNCGELNAILSDLHDRFKNKNVTPLAKTLAVVTEPYLLSGAKVGNKNLWRLTFDICSNNALKKIRKLPDGVEFKVGDKRIVFPKGKILMGMEHTQYDPCCGYWIEMPISFQPVVFSAPDYYIKNPAYGMNFEASGALPKEISQGNPMGYGYFNTYTLFGEKPDKLVCSLKFRITEKIENYAYLLWNGAFADNGVRSQLAFRPVIGETTANDPIKTTVPFYFMYKAKKITGASHELEIGRSYELKLTETIDRTERKMNVAYELWQQNEYGTMEQVEVAKKVNTFDFHKDDTNNHELLAPYLIYTFLGDAATNSLMNRLVIEDFKVYFDEHYEKIEIFRERDGVNVGRVNRNNDAYESIPENVGFECGTEERLIAKFTWLNATNSAQEYKLQYFQNGKECGVGRNCVFPADSTVRTSKALPDIREKPQKQPGVTFADTGQIIVTPNSEGYVLIDLPKTLPKTTKVTLKLQSLGPPTWGSSGFENKLKQQDRIYRIQRTIEITVDIEELGINRIPKNIEGEREK